MREFFFRYLHYRGHAGGYIKKNISSNKVYNKTGKSAKEIRK